MIVNGNERLASELFDVYKDAGGDPSYADGSGTNIVRYEIPLSGSQTSFCSAISALNISRDYSYREIAEKTRRPINLARCRLPTGHLPC